jgi:hypothetical protein
MVFKSETILCNYGYRASCASFRSCLSRVNDQELLVDQAEAKAMASWKIHILAVLPPLHFCGTTVSYRRLSLQTRHQ